MPEERVVVAEILRPRGNRGEVLVRSQTDVPGRLEHLKQAQVRLRDGSDVAVNIVDSWRHRQEWVLKFAGVDSISEAERFRASDLWVPREQRGALPDGEFFESDLVGCTVVDRATERELGPVQGWQRYGGPPLMEVNVDGREVLIPFVSAMCDVDLARRTIQVDVPEGLLDL
jgi:16S rRNA processing protein RimM